MATKATGRGMGKKWVAIFVLIGIIAGSSVVWAFKPPVVVSRPSEVVSLPELPTKPVTPPTGWDTAFSQKLDIKLLAQYDSSGPATWDAAKHPLVYITTNGPGYGGFLSGLNEPGIAIIDGNTYELILTKQYKLEGVKNYWEDHGVGVSPDGKWIYLPTGDLDKPVQETGRLLIINARTLKLHQVLQTSSQPHHVKAFKLYDGRDVVLVENFNWQVKPSIAPGSGVYLLDPKDNNRVIGGFRSEDIQGNPYLSFPHPDGRHLFVGLPPGPIRDPDIFHNMEGSVVVIDMKTWEPVKYYKAGFDPIWITFTADGKYAYVGDGGSDEIFKIDNVKQAIVGVSRSSVHGGYGIHLDWNQTMLFVVEKGESSHNKGKMLGLVDPIAMTPKDNFYIGILRGDHGLVHPDPKRNELWISSNSNFRDVVFDMKGLKVKATIEHSGSSHNGAFVEYTILPNGDWVGELLSDQAGLHGSARVKQQQLLEVKEIVYGKEKNLAEYQP